MSRSEAIALGRAKFADVFAAPLWHLPSLPAGQTVDAYVDDFRLFVKTGKGRERMLVQSSLPVSAVNEQGQREPVSTDLEQSAGGAAAPENSAAPITTGAHAAAPIEFERSGVGVTLVGASETAPSVDGDKVIYPAALPDTDYTVAAMPNGAETFLQMRSPEAPEEVRFRFDLPAGAHLRLTANAVGSGTAAPVGAEVVKDGRVIQSVAPPAAVDADKRNVPVRYSLEGNDLILKVDHTAGDFLYPILVDPYFLEGFSNPFAAGFGYYETQAEFQNWECTWNTNCGSGTGLGGSGLYIAATGPYPYGANASWYFRAPRGSQIPRAEFAWGHTAVNSCVFAGIVNAEWTVNQGGWWAYCNNDVYGSTEKGYHVQCTEPTCGTGGSTQGNYARVGLMMKGGAWNTAWTQLRYGYVFMWEGWAPYFRSLAPVDASQWDEATHQTRWLREGELFQYRYNVHDDGLGLDWVDDNNFGRGSRSAVTGACDIPSTSCAYDYTVPEGGSSWRANDTAAFPEGVTPTWARAFDNVGNQGCCYSWNIRVDKTPPSLDVWGSLSSLDGQTVTAGKYDLFVTSRDGDPSSPAAQRSGVKSMNLQILDPNGVARRINPQWANCGPGNCSKGDSLPFDTNDYAVPYGFGTWTFRITAHDQLDHGVQRDIKVTFTRPDDRTKPVVDELSGSLSKKGQWVSDFVPDLTVQATDVGSGVRTATFRVDGVAKETISNSCSAPTQCGSTLRHTFKWNVEGVQQGVPHDIKLVITDAVGNEYVDGWAIRLDGTRPEQAVGGALWDHRNQSGDHRSEGLYDATYQLHVDATDSPSGVREIEVYVDGVSQRARGGYASQPSSADGAPLALDWTLRPDDYSDGERRITVVVRDRAGNATSAEFRVTVDRRGNVYRASEFTDQPSTPADAIAVESATLGGQHARHEDGDQIVTRHNVPCSKPAGNCGEVRYRSRFSDQDSNESDTYSIYRGSAPDDPNLDRVADMLRSARRTANQPSAASGPIKEAAEPWQILPPGHSAEYRRYNRTWTDEDENGERSTFTEATWSDAETHLPIKERVTNADGGIEFEMFFSYSLERAELSEMPAGHFAVPPPQNRDSESEVEFQGNEPIGNRQDAETGTAFSPYYLGPQPAILAATYCLTTTDTVRMHDPLAGNEIQDPDVEVPVGADITYVGAYYALSDPTACTPGNGEPPPAADLSVRSMARTSSYAAAFRSWFIDGAGAVETDPLRDDYLTAGIRPVDFNGDTTSAYVISLDGDVRSALIETGNSTLLITGEFSRDQIQAIADQLEAR